MITEDTIWEEVWPVVEQLIEATLEEDNSRIFSLLLPNSQAADIAELFGFPAFDILLKTVLGRERLGLSRAIEADNGRSLFIEFAWPDPEAQNNSYTAADVVSVRLEPQTATWKIAEVNPANADLPLTAARARGILTTSKLLTEEDKVPAEPWVLPLAFFAGVLQIPLLETAMLDEVESYFLPGLQHRTYGVLSLVRARRMWRDFKAASPTNSAKPLAWAAAIEFMMNEQDMRNLSQAAVSKFYKVNLGALVPCVRQIKQTLNIRGLDERYTDLQTTQIVYQDE